jgi:transcriptional regulator with XRE-family HTH domain
VSSGPTYENIGWRPGLSQENLAFRIETLDQGYISGLETGRRNPTAVTLWLLVEALEVPAGTVAFDRCLNESWARGAVKLVCTRSRRKKISIRAK